MSGTSRHWFVSPRGDWLPRWREAFPDALAVQLERWPDGVGLPLLIWVRLPADREVADCLASVWTRFRQAPIVALSDHPHDEEALACLAAGARGYCNSHAAPAVLRQVAETVLRDGLWIGASLMRRWRAVLAGAGI